jgi:hypothetical protein
MIINTSVDFFGLLYNMRLIGEIEHLVIVDPTYSLPEKHQIVATMVL